MSNCLRLSQSPCRIAWVDAALGPRAELLAHALRAQGHVCKVLQPSQDVESRVAALAPSLVLVDAAALEPDGSGLSRLRGAAPEAALVVLVSSLTPDELFEAVWRQGADDCLLGPVRLDSLQARIAALLHAEALPAVTGLPAPHAIHLVGGMHGARQWLCDVLVHEGFQVTHAASPEVPPQRPPALVVHLALGAAELDRDRGAARVPALAARGSESPEALLRRLEQELGLGTSQLRATERIPFFAPVESREVGVQEGWMSGFSESLSPGGIFVRTLVPPRPGAEVELRLHLGSTRAVVECTGVVAWANPWAPRGPQRSDPIGMGIEFRGMSPHCLDFLRQLWSAPES